MDPNALPKSYFIKDELRVGRVELCIDGHYKTLCYDQWDGRDASVVCHQLGFSRNGNNLWMPSDPSLVNCTMSFISGAINGSSYFSDEVFSTLTFGLNCTGTENSIRECPRHTAESSCGTHSDAHVICQGD